MAEERRDRQDELMRDVAKYLRELRMESGDLYARLDSLEKELGKELEKRLEKERERERLDRIADIVSWAEPSREHSAPAGRGDPLDLSFIREPEPSREPGPPAGHDDPLDLSFIREPEPPGEPGAPAGHDDPLDLSFIREPEPPGESGAPAGRGDPPGAPFTREPEAEPEPSAPGKKGRRVVQRSGGTVGRVVRVVGNVFFCVAVVALLVGAYLIRSAREGAPFNLAGYSGMLVLSGSMQDVIPKGSFILTKSVDPGSLQLGDDITYMLNATTTVTHRIIDIRPQTDGSLAFQTKGVNNTTPDSALVASANIVGKVIYHNYSLGLMAESVRDNWPLLLFLTVVFMVLCRVLAHIQQDDDSEKKEKGERAGSGVA